MERTFTSDLRTAPIIVWFRNDLRTSDNLALLTAAGTGNPLIPVFIREDARDALPLGGAQAWWLHHSLQALSRKLASLGAPLILRRGEPFAILRDIAVKTGAKTVVWNRRYAPSLSDRDATVKEALRADGLAAESFAGQLLHEPTRLRTGMGGPYRVFTPFWRAFLERTDPRPAAPAPANLIRFAGDIDTDDLASWSLLPKHPDWSAGIAAEWTPGEDGAQARLRTFIANALDGYAKKRDFPGGVHTSKLSPHLAFGEISPRQIWQAVDAVYGRIPSTDITTFRKEVGWREFSYHLLANYPTLPTENFNSDFDAFPWRDADGNLAKWQRGLTGYPIVDAGMRELWQTGWMHNRVRMIVGSFLVKHLLIDWRHGEAWFRDTLVDCDPASNTASWQWIAGSGADAAPYFRVFNPVLQGEKFDADGAYVRRFVPELARLPDRYLHRPWEAPEPELNKAGVVLGETYPRPVVDHRGARDRAMAAYNLMKEKAA